MNPGTQGGAIVPIGTMTPWGKVVAIGRYRDGERWYMMDRKGSTSLMTGRDVEASAAKPAEGTEAEQGNTEGGAREGKG